MSVATTQSQPQPVASGSGSSSPTITSKSSPNSSQEDLPSSSNHNVPRMSMTVSRTHIQTSNTSPRSTASTTPETTPKAKVDMNRPIKVIVVSDVICPWCYICFNDLNSALQKLSLSRLPLPSPKFEIEFRPFPLVTNFGSDDVAIEKNAFFANRFGAERAKEVLSMIEQRAKKSGMEFKWGGLMRQTSRAHRLLTLAYHRGGMALQQTLLAHLFKAYFEEEKDIGSPSVLAFYADLVGLMPRDDAEEWIKGKGGEEEVKRLIDISMGCQIKGVPFVVVDGKWAISGGQEESVYYNIFEKIAKGEKNQDIAMPPPGPSE